MRTRLGGAVLVLTTLAGCTEAAADPPRPAASPTPLISQRPVSVAGGACRLLDYDTIEAALGVRFKVAAAGRKGATYTCVVQGFPAKGPDLALAVTATTADPAVFRDTMVPKGAKPVTGLGKAAYQARVANGFEVGWLSGDKRLITLRHTVPPDGTGDADGLVQLAKKVDKSRI